MNDDQPCSGKGIRLLALGRPDGESRHDKGSADLHRHDLPTLEKRRELSENLDLGDPGSHARAWVTSAFRQLKNICLASQGID
jgi:hypothetical protein